MKKLFAIFTLFFLSFNANATHFAGGEIWYEYVSGNIYKVHARLYRDCKPGNAGMTTSLGITRVSLSNNLSYNFSFSLDTSYSVVNTCTPNWCQNVSSTMPGFEVWEYSYQDTIVISAADWEYSWSSCCRNAAVVNLNPNQGSIFLYATLDNLNTPFNNSVYSPSPIQMVYNNSQITTLNVNPVELDGDSLDFQFVPNYQTNINQPFSYSLPYSFSNPFGSPTAPFLDPLSGTMIFNVPNTGVYAFAIQIREYRNGLLVSTCLRDYQFYIIANGNNQLPTLTGVNATNIFTASVPVCNTTNTTLSFAVNSADLDLADSTFISTGYIMPGATFNTNNAQNQSGTFTWNVSAADIRAQPYVLNLLVKDNQCITGQQSYGYLIYVNHCATDSVWAGDANADFTCNNYDVLNIGIAAGSSGTARPGASTNWQAEYCPNWTSNFINNINFKHADCNGDGVVNSFDINAVSANYGLVHQKDKGIHPMKIQGLPDLYFDVTNVLAYKGTTVNIPIMLGNTSSTMDDIYGIATTIEAQNALLSSPMSLTNNTNWIGNIGNSLFFQKSIASNKLDLTNVRINQQNISGQGQIATLVLPIDANSVTGSKIILDFKNAKLIKNDESEIVQFNILMDSITILDPLSVNEINDLENVQLFPNPANDFLNIQFISNENDNYNIKITDLAGKICATYTFEGKAGKNLEKINIQSLSFGTYNLEIKNGASAINKSFIKK